MAGTMESAGCGPPDRRVSAHDPFVEWRRKHSRVIDLDTIDRHSAYAEIREAAREQCRRSEAVVAKPYVPETLTPVIQRVIQDSNGN